MTIKSTTKFTTQSGEVYRCVEASIDICPEYLTDDEAYLSTMTIEWLPDGADANDSDAWQTAIICDKRMNDWEIDKVMEVVGDYLHLLPECRPEIDIAYI